MYKLQPKKPLINRVTQVISGLNPLNVSFSTYTDKWWVIIIYIQVGTKQTFPFERNGAFPRLAKAIEVDQ